MSGGMGGNTTSGIDRLYFLRDMAAQNPQNPDMAQMFMDAYLQQMYPQQNSLDSLLGMFGPGAGMGGMQQEPYPQGSPQANPNEFTIEVPDDPMGGPAGAPPMAPPPSPSAVPGPTPQASAMNSFQTPGTSSMVNAWNQQKPLNYQSGANLYNTYG